MHICTKENNHSALTWHDINAKFIRLLLQDDPSIPLTVLVFIGPNCHVEFENEMGEVKPVCLCVCVHAFYMLLCVLHRGDFLFLSMTFMKWFMSLSLQQEGKLSLNWRPAQLVKIVISLIIPSLSTTFSLLLFVLDSFLLCSPVSLLNYLSLLFAPCSIFFFARSFASVLYFLLFLFVFSQWWSEQHSWSVLSIFPPSLMPTVRYTLPFPTHG